MLLNTHSFTENHEYRSSEILSIARKIKKQIESIREEDE